MFRGRADGGGRVRGINAKGAAADFSRKRIDELTAYVKQDFGAKGLAWFKVEADGKLASPIAKNFSDDSAGEDRPADGRLPGDLLLLRGRRARSHLQGPVTACGNGWGRN